jgi:hypothetical protein
MPERVLTQRELNRALLARQLLLKRTPLPRALERIGGIQAQYAPSMYIGLWSRLDGFRREFLTRALERRTVVQGTLMRSTIHLVSARDYWAFAVAVVRARRDHWLRAATMRPQERDLAAAARRLRRRLAERSPLSRTEVEEVVGKDHGFGVGLWFDLVRVPPSGTWERRRADLYAAAEERLGPPDVSPQEGIDFLVRRYLGGFGPASRADIARFAGLPLRDIGPSLERLALRRFRDEAGAELLDLPRAPLPDAETPAPVRFLPTWDATLLSHTRRSGVLPEQYRALVFNTRTHHSSCTFIVDGVVAGIWRHERGRITIEPFERLDRSTRRKLDDEAEALSEFHA